MFTDCGDGSCPNTKRNKLNEHTVSVTQEEWVEFLMYCMNIYHARFFFWCVTKIHGLLMPKQKKHKHTSGMVIRYAHDLKLIMRKLSFLHT